MSYGAGGKGIKQSRVTRAPGAGVGFLFPGICTLAEAGEVDVNEQVVDPVQHMKSVVESALF